MAQYLRRLRIIEYGICGACVWIFSHSYGVAQSLQLQDPTRPPPSIGTGGTTGVNETTQTELETGPALQSIKISPTRKEAMISGQTVKVGDKVGDATVINITESGVVLRKGKETQTLKLFPDVEKRFRSGKAGKTN